MTQNIKDHINSITDKSKVNTAKISSPLEFEKCQLNESQRNSKKQSFREIPKNSNSKNIMKIFLEKIKNELINDEIKNEIINPIYNQIYLTILPHYLIFMTILCIIILFLIVLILININNIRYENVREL